jgi:hypothetical protein
MSGAIDNTYIKVVIEINSMSYINRLLVHS